jgi:nucleotide-binding universal stress UspA family protein
MFRQLLVAFHGSPSSRAALDEAIELAQASNGRLTVLTVIPAPARWALGFSAGMTVDVDELSAEAQRAYQAMLDDAVSIVPGNVPVTKVLRRGSAARAIEELAHGADCDLVVMGARGLGALRSLLVRSVSHRVLRASPVPVLVVHVEEGDGSPEAVAWPRRVNATDALTAGRKA